MTQPIDVRVVKYLDQSCLLCSNKPVRYLKTLGGFHKVCDSCRGVLIRAGLDVEPDVIHVAEAPASQIVHGSNCNKVKHTRTGYLHGEDDDSPYSVDHVKYCGRCHVVL